MTTKELRRIRRLMRRVDTAYAEGRFQEAEDLDAKLETTLAALERELRHEERMAA